LILIVALAGGLVSLGIRPAIGSVLLRVFRKLPASLTVVGTVELWMLPLFLMAGLFCLGQGPLLSMLSADGISPSIGSANAAQTSATTLQVDAG
jgi:hypothetical protein